MTDQNNTKVIMNHTTGHNHTNFKEDKLSWILYASNFIAKYTNVNNLICAKHCLS
jgi:hypothetical protein